VSRLAASPVAAFVATVESGPDGVFTYDASTDTLTPRVLEGDAAGGGRLFCSFSAVGLGNGVVAFQAFTKVNCGDLTELPVAGLFLEEAGVVTPIVAAGDTAPIAGATYYRFFGRPEVNASKAVAFRAQVAGSVNVRALFLFDPGMLTVSTVAAGGDTAPGGGSLTKQGPAVLTEAGDSFAMWGTRFTAARQTIFLFDASPASAVLSTDPVPTDQFGAGTTYKKLNEPRSPRDGSRLAFLARVLDTALPGGKAGVFRCIP
jgi:hypothetical protein